MNKIVTQFALLVFTMSLSAQTVENIRVEQEGENLLIHYRIGASTADQLYDVKLTCTIDNGPVYEPKSVIGDVGKNIRGGKSFNTIVWDVFEDVDEIGSVEFFVEVVLVEDESTSQPLTAEQTRPQTISNQPTMINQQPVTINQAAPDKGKQARGFMLAYCGSTNYPLGLSIGSLKNWGWYLSGRLGTEYDIYSYTYFPTGSITGGITKRFTEGEKISLYGYTGAGAGGYLDAFQFEIGFIGKIMNRVSLGIGAEYVSYYDVGGGVISLGLVF
jgi:hypothetical protein